MVTVIARVPMSGGLGLTQEECRSRVGAIKVGAIKVGAVGDRLLK